MNKPIKCFDTTCELYIRCPRTCEKDSQMCYDIWHNPKGVEYGLMVANGNYIELFSMAAEKLNRLRRK